MELQDSVALASGRAIVQGEGIPGATYMVIGEAPGRNEAKKKRPFVGKSGQLLRQTLNSLGIPDEDVYFTNVCWFHPEENRTPTAAEVEGSLPRLLQEIKLVQPQKILTCGVIPADALGLKPSRVGITSSRGLGQMLPGGIFAVPTLHPAYILRSPQFFRDFVYDIEKLRDRDKPFSLLEDLNYYVAQTPDEAVSYLSNLFSASVLSFDIETTGFDHFSDTILMWGFGALTSNNKGVVFEIPHTLVEGNERVREHLAGFFRDWEGTLYIHNAKFDIKWVYRSFGNPFPLPRIRDTLHMHSILDERPGARGGVHDLKSLSRLFYDFPYEKLDFDAFVDLYYQGELTSELWEEMYLYLAKDCFVTVLLGQDLEKKLREESSKFMPLLDEHIMPSVIEFARTELEGVPVHQGYLKQLNKEVSSDVEETRLLLQRAVNRVAPELHEPELPFPLVDWNMSKLLPLLDDEDFSKVTRWWDELRELEDELEVELDPDLRSSLQRRIRLRENKIRKAAESVGLYRKGSGPFNAGSHVQVKAAFERLGLDLASGTDKESLLFARLNATDDRVKDFISALIDYRLFDRLKSTYVDGLTTLSEKTGACHPKFQLNGASSGRISCTSPNLQNIPTLVGPLVRRAFTAPPGWVWAAVDYSQLELRVAAFYSRDQAMIQAYRDGRDIHTEVAVAAYGVPYDQVTYNQRYAAKYIDFGVIYGRSAISLVTGWEMVEHWHKTGETPWSVKQAQTFIDNFLGQFSGLQKWIQDQHNFVREHQYVESAIGRRRRFPLIVDYKTLGETERKAVNSPIQGLASDICLRAYTLCSQKLPRQYARPLIAVHDEIDFLIREDKVREVVPVIIKIMAEEAPPPEILDVVPIEVDVELGVNWGDITEDWKYIGDQLHLQDYRDGQAVFVPYSELQETYYEQYGPFTG